MGIFDVTDDCYRSMIEHMLTEGEEFEFGIYGYPRDEIKFSLLPKFKLSSCLLYMFVTNKRVIQLLKRYSIIGSGNDVTDILYEDVSNVRHHKGMMGSDIYLKPRHLGDDMFISWVDNKSAEKAVTLIRNHISDVIKQNKEKQNVTIEDNRGKRVCPKCGWQNEREAKFCSDCGFSFGIKKEE